MNKRGNLTFIGIAESGKSSFIAGLWHVIESKELDDSLKVKALPTQREYLNDLRTAWLSCKKLTRNVGDFKNDITLNVTLPTGDEIDLLFPDLAGEIYESQFTNRQMKQDFVDKLNSTSDIVLFINPDNLKKGNLISDAGFLEDLGREDNEETLKDEQNGLTTESNDPSSPLLNESVQDPEIPWIHKFAPTQVVLVDLLQMILEYVENPKIAVVISAWDLVLNLPDNDLNKKPPLEWLKSELPLLFQYLDSNQDLLKFRIFGISAQGGDYEKTTDKSMLQENLVQSTRINVQLENGEMKKDISLPIKWILNGEG